ncbi:MAG TPA: undecaprenyl-diphosphate phosphatase [Baekduia sp.]|uniref:undecaprenyl-diphosphate phosphatase n=1 Tax=Baekduia sp. TaxID=2600305 RepID=UPI002D78710C|nr:undecaprenyl-diphosphate phosphatase [Baekduia sp.]HET6508899.1 undecaprenyl-diphosphate phosphatase [Baekduia sp.]
MSRELSLVQAVALGALHGPAELLPVSSSAHVALVPRLLGWRTLPPELEKAFEVMLHAGTLGGLALIVPWPSPRFALATTLPGAVVGLTLERPIERRLGGTRATAAGLVAGSLAMLVADRRDRGSRPAESATTRDALALGVAQACALWPGVSRLGLTLAAARTRGFSRDASFALARTAGLPVVAGATLLKGVRLAQSPPPPALRAPFAAGVAAAFASTLAAAPLRRVTALAPWAAERIVLAGLAVRRSAR